MKYKIKWTCCHCGHKHKWKWREGRSVEGWTYMECDNCQKETKGDLRQVDNKTFTLS